MTPILLPNFKSASFLVHMWGEMTFSHSNFIEEKSYLELHEILPLEISGGKYLYRFKAKEKPKQIIVKEAIHMRLPACLLPYGNLTE